MNEIPATPAPFVELERRAQPDQIFRQLLAAAPDAVVVVDGEGRIVFSNEQTGHLFGYEPGALLGQPVELLLPERLRSSHGEQRRRFSAAPRTRPMGSGLDLCGRRSDKSEFPIEISLSPLATHDGMLFSASIRDISARKDAESVVRRGQAHLLSAVESIQGAFAIFDAADRLVLCNSGYRQLVAGTLTGEITGRTFGELLQALDSSTLLGVDSDRPQLAASWGAYHAVPNGTLDLVAADGQHLRVIERRTAEGGTVTLISDISDDVRHEEELRHAQSLAEAASSAKSEFLASMSHELRTPLNAILGFAQLLQRDKKSPLSQRQLERIDHVLLGGEHLLRLIDDVLDLARIESGRTLVSLERVDVAEILAEVKVTLLSLAARADMQVRIEPVPPRAAQVIADRTRLKQVLMNFGSNAIKYGRANGSVTLSTSTTNGLIRIAVNDDGMGIARDKQPTLFQPFQRAGQEAGPIEGTGIGLVISKRLSELMGGSVGFESEEGRGSSFWLELRGPAQQEPAPASASPSATPGSSPLAGELGPRYVIVYVEDNPSNIAFMQDLLADFERVELVTAPTAELGLELSRARRPDVIIMDINLPGMSGIEASRWLKQWPETRDIPILALSAAAMIRDVARVRAGFYRYLTKPVKVDELVATLEELLTPKPAS